MTDLQRYESDNGVELYIDIQTGESWASIRGAARMCNKDDSAIRRFTSAAQMDLKKAEVPTSTGLKTAALLSEDQLLEVILKYNPSLAKAFMKAGLRVFLHGLAGYQVTSTAMQGFAPQPLPNLLPHVEALEVSQVYRYIQDNVACDDPRLAQILIDRAMQTVQPLALPGTAEPHPILRILPKLGALLKDSVHDGGLLELSTKALHSLVSEHGEVWNPRKGPALESALLAGGWVKRTSKSRRIYWTPQALNPKVTKAIHPDNLPKIRAILANS